MKNIVVQNIVIPVEEIEFRGIRSGGPGGQHVNKVSSAVQLQFDILNSSLADEVKVKLIQTGDGRISKKGKFTIKASSSRSQSKNRALAIERFKLFLEDVLKPKKKRIAVKISKAVKEKRKIAKQRKSEKKANRKKIKL